MPKKYYRCHNCHIIVKRGFDIIDRFGGKLFGGPCPNCKIYRSLYSAEHTYWWERFYLTIRDFIRNLLNRSGIKK